MKLSIKKNLSFQLITVILLITLCAFDSFAEDSGELKKRLEQLQQTLQGAAPDEPQKESGKGLKALEELLKKEGITDSEKKGLENKLKILKGQISSEGKPIVPPLVSIEEPASPKAERRFYIDGKYWLAYIGGGNKEAASSYSIDTRLPTASPLETSLNSTSPFAVSAGYKHLTGKTIIKFWHLEPKGSLTGSATSTIGISGTEASDYYYQNIHRWNTAPFATKGVSRVDANSNLNATNLDIFHTIAVGKGSDKEFGVVLGLKYAQVDSRYTITYSSPTSPLYNINSDVGNTILAPIFGIYGEGPIFKSLRFNGLLDISVAWDRVKAKRFEYDNTVPQTALDAGQAYDLALTIIEGEVGVIYPLGRNLSFGVDYKTALLSGLPFELKTKESAFIETLELLKRDILFHGLTVGVSYVW